MSAPAPSRPPGVTPDPSAEAASLPDGAARTRGGEAEAVRRVVAAARPQQARYAAAVLLGGGALGGGVALLALSAWLIARASQHPGLAALSVAIVGVRFFALSRGLFRYGERLESHDATFRVLADLRVAVYTRLERLAPAGLPAFRRGDLLARMVADVDSLQDLFLRALSPPAVAALVAALAVGTTAFWAPSVALALAGCLVVAGVAVPWLASALAGSAERAVTRQRAELGTGVVELLRAAPELVAYGVAEDRLRALDRTDTALTRSLARSATTAGAGAGLSAAAAGAAVWAALALGTPMVRDGSLDPVLLAVVVLLPFAAFEAVAGLPLAAQYLRRTARSAQRVGEVLDAPEPVVDPRTPQPLPGPPYTLRVEGATARWTPDSPPALDGLDLLLPPGRRVAVVGPSGSGKSTLAAVLLRFLDPVAGTVRVNGRDVTEFAADDLRKIVGLCAQDAHVFDTTLEENLRVANRLASPEQVAQALDRARLSPWVATLPDLLDTRLGEHGSRMSGGQRQRLALARALLADFPVLVLDEPTANLDLATADALTADLLAATEGRTTLLITHRLAGLQAVDEIVVLAAGRAVERGTHDDLLALGGRYATAWELERATDTLR